MKTFMLRMTLAVLFFTLLGCSESQDDRTVSNPPAITLPPSEETSPLKAPVEEGIPSNWYIRLVAEDSVRGLKTESTQLGGLEDTDIQKYALESAPPFGRTYLDVLFENPTGIQSGSYKSIFYTYDETKESRWKFTVSTDDTTAIITLYARGLFILEPYIDQQNRRRFKEYRSYSNPLLKHMKLIDLTTQAEIPAMMDGAVNKYTFSMDAQKKRSFEWVVQTTELNATLSPARAAQRAVVKEDFEAMIKEKKASYEAEPFDIHTPPPILPNW